ncbi:hypothetical protein GPECTOR_1005g272 [Gonium pectorale]|uniref:inosine/xanthosine triphosphatase n=1 Tax=Gonium pectorale TaxID=33097 RepID=A0A150FTR6_GONPE|nr:hypothetical protein GPECTOR_1005g272 [Gonium pectorale]|eukprot:KXZ41004.1 hypothetical protein GPECTOR_1005g272 [Gonium pectorale]
MLAQRVAYVASKNPVKVNAVKRALELCFPAVVFSMVGREAPSGVPDQPHGDNQTLEGVAAASVGLGLPNTGAAGAEAASADAALVVAIEGGVGRSSGPGSAGSLECFAWVCVRDPVTGAESTARSASFALPPPLVDLMVRDGLELGDADDKLFRRTRSKQGSGTIGHLSNGVLDRTEFYVQAAVCALLPFMQPQLYGKEYGRLLAGADEAGGEGRGG